MIDFLILSCIAYTVIDLTSWAVRGLPEWMAHNDDDRP